MHLADNYLVFFHQIAHLALNFADSAVYIVELRVVPALNHTIILRMLFLHQFNPSIDK